MAEKRLSNEPDGDMDAITAELRRLDLQRPDGRLRQRVLEDVDAVLRQRSSGRSRFKPALAWTALAGALWVLLSIPWGSSHSMGEIPATYVESTAQWLDLSPELARHVVRPMSTSGVPKHVTTREGRLRHATRSAIDL